MVPHTNTYTSITWQNIRTYVRSLTTADVFEVVAYLGSGNGFCTVCKASASVSTPLCASQIFHSHRYVRTLLAWWFVKLQLTLAILASLEAHPSPVPAKHTAQEPNPDTAWHSPSYGVSMSYLCYYCAVCTVQFSGWRNHTVIFLPINPITDVAAIWWHEVIIAKSASVLQRMGFIFAGLRVNSLLDFMCCSRACRKPVAKEIVRPKWPDPHEKMANTKLYRQSSNKCTGLELFRFIIKRNQVEIQSRRIL